MIQFRCNCGHRLSVPESEAGDTTQCPSCGRLRSVPALDELDAIADDGTIRLSDGPSPRAAGSGRQEPAVEATPVAPLELEYSGVGSRGSVDLRTPVRRRPGKGSAAEAEPSRVERPKYDPETGQRIVAHDLADAAPPAPQDREVEQVEEVEEAERAEDAEAGLLAFRDPDPPATARRARSSEFSRVVPQQRAKKPAAVAEAVPVAQAATSAGPPAARQRTLNYAGKTTRRPGGAVPLDLDPVYWYTIPRELFRPTNLFVLVIVFGVHLLAQVFEVFAAGGAVPLVLVSLGIWLLLVAHYGIVLEETGAEKRDELPPVLRNVSFYDDVFSPLIQLATALLICGVPAVATVYAAVRTGVGSGPTLLVTFGVLTACAIAFPAVWITTATSGSLHNLLPHRILAVALRSPLEYAVAVAALPVMLCVYWAGMALTAALSLSVNTTATLLFPGGMTWTPPIWALAALGYPLLALGIYLAHGFCWLLGKIYQEHHEEYPWVLQRHVSTRTDPAKQLERERIEAIRAEREERAKRASAQVRERLSV